MAVDTKKRNRNAGKHPSYKGRSKKAIANKRAYDKKYHQSEKRKKYRAALNKKNRELQRKGKAKVGDKKDVSHTKKGGTTLEKQSSNRGRNGRNGSSTKK